MRPKRYTVIVVGGGHAGAEAAWAAANLLGEPGSVALVTLRADTIGVMSCNPAIGGLAKGQLVGEIDALGGLMGLAADATGIHFRMLNTSRGPAVHGPRAQCDRIAYARAVGQLIESRGEIDLIEGSAESLVVERGSLRGVVVSTPSGVVHLDTPSLVLTTGTFMRGLMHKGADQTPGGRTGEAPANTMSRTLTDLGFELGRLKTGTPPRLDRRTIDYATLTPQPGDETPVPFSDLSRAGWTAGALTLSRFPRLAQVDCHQTSTNSAIHELIRANLHRAPIYSGAIEGTGPRYCPSIEDKVVRFADRTSHGVFLEPESHADTRVYCNGISTSLPRAIQDQIVALLPGCRDATILQHGYAVEYDMVKPHQILASGMTRRVEGLLLAGQINGTSGYEEAAAQGLIAGVNAVRFAQGRSPWIPGRHEGYLGVLMDDLVTKTPTEPYRMFTSRAEHRLVLRADNAADRLTPVAIELGLLETTELGAQRRALFEQRRREIVALTRAIAPARVEHIALERIARRPGFGIDEFRAALPGVAAGPGVWATVLADLKYASYIERQRGQIDRQLQLERKAMPDDLDAAVLEPLRTEAREALARYRPRTLGQASRLEGITPADLTLLAVVIDRRRGR